MNPCPACGKVASPLPKAVLEACSCGASNTKQRRKGQGLSAAKSERLIRDTHTNPHNNKGQNL